MLQREMATERDGWNNHVKKSGGSHQNLPQTAKKVLYQLFVCESSFSRHGIFCQLCGPYQATSWPNLKKGKAQKRITLPTFWYSSTTATHSALKIVLFELHSRNKSLRIFALHNRVSLIMWNLGTHIQHTYVQNFCLRKLESKNLRSNVPKFLGYPLLLCSGVIAAQLTNLTK